MDCIALLDSLRAPRQPFVSLGRMMSMMMRSYLSEAADVLIAGARTERVGSSSA